MEQHGSHFFAACQSKSLALGGNGCGKNVIFTRSSARQRPERYRATGAPKCPDGSTRGLLERCCCRMSLGKIANMLRGLRAMHFCLGRQSVVLGRECPETTTLQLKIFRTSWEKKYTFHI
jgi:hypothetical protein